MERKSPKNDITGFKELQSCTFKDNRGSFNKIFGQQVLGLPEAWGGRTIKQVNISKTEKVGTIRGIHLQKKAHVEAKLVICVRGRVWDVVVDLRSDSSSYGQWRGVELSSAAKNIVLIPEGCGHGFQVLEPESELLYLHSGTWELDAESGVRFDDPKLAIQWPLPPRDLSERDLALPLLKSIT